VTCHKEPLSILVGAAVYSSGCRCLFCLISTSALFAVRVRVLVVGVFGPSLCLDCGGMKDLSIGG